LTLKVIETFSGIGAQAKALSRLKKSNPTFDYEIVSTVEWEIGASYAYDVIHNGDQNLEEYDHLSKEELINMLSELNLSSDGKKPLTFTALKRMPLDQLKAIKHSIDRNNNLVDISLVTATDLPDADLLTYSFPCQDLSIGSFWHGNFSGINKGANNRSSLLWEIERILNEYHVSNKKKPQFLLMENVTAINSPQHEDNFNAWKTQLEKLGYLNYVYDLNATNFNIPQNRNRTFMISIYSEDLTPSLIKLSQLYLNLLGLKKDLSLLDMSNFLRLDYSNDTYFKEALESIPNYTPSRMRIHDKAVILAEGNLIKNDIAKTITTKQDRHPTSGLIEHHIEGLDPQKAPYRNLTPRETFLLMGFDEQDFDNLMRNNFNITNKKKFLSHSKLLVLSGNSIVVNVLEAIFEKIHLLNNLFQSKITPECLIKDLSSYRLNNYHLFKSSLK